MLSIARKISPSTIIFLVLFCVGVSVCASDIYIPAGPLMVHDLKTTAEMITMSLSAGMYGICLGAPIWGSISDDWGRRKVLIIGLVLFATAAILGGLTDDIHAFLAYRFVQGLGAGAVQGLGAVVVTDFYSRAQAARYISYLGSIITLCLIIAPVVGGFCATYWHWRAGFFVLGGMALLMLLLVVLLMRETLSAEHRTKFSLRTMFSNKWRILSKWQFWAYNIIPAITIGALISFQANISFLFFHDLNMSGATLGMLLSVHPLVNCIVSTIVGRHMPTIGFKRALSIGMLLMTIGTVAFTCASYLYGLRPGPIIATLALVALSLPFFMPVLTTLSFDLFTGMRGMVASLANSVRVLFIALGIQFGTFCFNHTLLSIAVAFITINLVIIVLFFCIITFTKIDN